MLSVTTNTLTRLHGFVIILLAVARAHITGSDTFVEKGPPKNTTVIHDTLKRDTDLVRQINAFDAGLIALGAALNVSIGYLVNLLKLPIYLDSIGTVFVAALCGWRYGAIVGLAALVVLSVTAIPTSMAYAGTAIVIALISSGLARFGFLKNIRATIIGGLILGLGAAAASAPVTTLVYGGVSIAGSDAITALFRAMGYPLWKSVIFGKLLIDPLDKLVTALICFSLVQSLPPRMLERLTRK
ncbi:ECF transporter S component [bacterium]|nr:ECF transporter S component [bacterium]